jgi:hypothetical protein
MGDIKGVEIMSLGTWNGHKISEETLSNVLEAWQDTKGFAAIPLKLGHNDEQKLLTEDGLPAAGWVTNLYVQGKKLLADFTEIPTKIYELIKRKAYRKVSVELFCGYKFNNKEYPCLLGAVALLGSDLPAMATLSDIMGMYSYALPVKSFNFSENRDTIKKITFDNGEKDVADQPSEAEVLELKKKLEAQEKQLKGMEDQVQSFKQDKASFETYKQETEKKLSSLEVEKEKAVLESFCLDLQKKDLLSPSMKPFVEALYTSAKGVEKFSVGEKEIAGKDVIEQLLTLAKEVFKVNKTEKTTNETPKDDNFTEEIVKKIDELMKADKKLSYAQAYKLAFKKS